MDLFQIQSWTVVNHFSQLPLMNSGKKGGRESAKLTLKMYNIPISFRCFLEIIKFCALLRCDWLNHFLWDRVEYEVPFQYPARKPSHYSGVSGFGVNSKVGVQTTVHIFVLLRSRIM